MYSKFDGIPLEKQQKILNAAMKIFGESGYEKASTNRIVQEAGISKGLLFHYFSSKKQLFLYVYDYCVQFLMDVFYDQVDLSSRDFFEKLDKIALVKLEIIDQHPLIFKFVEQAYFDAQSDELSDEMTHKNVNLLNTTMTTIFTDIDRSLFKDNIDVDKAIQTVFWATEGFSQTALQKSKYQHQPIDYPKLFAEAQDYYDFLKTCFYK